MMATAAATIETLIVAAVAAFVVSMYLTHHKR